MLQLGHADAMVCGTVGHFRHHLDIVANVVGYRHPEHTACAMNALIFGGHNLFIADTYVNDNPTAEQIAQSTLMCAEEIRRFGIVPKAALLSHSNFGSVPAESAEKMRRALEIIRRADPQLEIDGEMQGDAALVESLRQQSMPDSTLKGAANLLVMPNVEAANISCNLLRVASPDGVTVGPILLGMKKPVHIINQLASVRRLVNMVALAAVDAQRQG